MPTEANLAALPQELVSRICRVLGRVDSNQHGITYDNTDFYSLRLTCRALYEKTIYDMPLRHSSKNESCRFRHPMVMFNHDGLALLLHLSNIAHYREKLLRISLLDPTRLKSSVDGDHAAQQLAYLDWEQELEFIRSSEALHMCMAIFKNLRMVWNLTGVHVACGHGIVLEALEAVQYPVKVLNLLVEPDQL